MRPLRRVFVVGGSQTDFLGRGHPRWVHPREGANPSLEEHLHGVIRAALAETGAAPSQVDRLVVANFLGECFARQAHLGAMAAGAHPALEGTPAMRVEGACASGGLAVCTAIDALQGLADVVLVAGVEVETNVRGRDGVDFVARAAHTERQRHLSYALFPHLFALRARAYKERFGVSDADVARVVVKAWGQAADNPLALHHATPITLEEVLTPSEINTEFLEDPELAPHMRTHECTAFSDGAAAVVLASEAGLARLGVDPRDCTEIVGIGWSVRDLGATPDPTALDNLAAAAGRAYGAAGIGPDDLDLAEVHDCFAITELQAVEALGICAPGQAGAWVREGRTDRGGDLPVNPGGGLLGTGHPIGATGVRQVLEIWRQATGRAGGYQLAEPPRHAVTANLGGDDRTAVVLVHRSP